jgi:hypothetical protein
MVVIKNFHGEKVVSNPGVPNVCVGWGERSDPIDRSLQMVFLKCSLYSIFIKYEKKEKIIL